MTQKSYSKTEQIAQTYYDNYETDQMYATIWGGEHIHFGIYQEPQDSIHEAAQRTVKTMAQSVRRLDAQSRVIDLGAGYGGTARYLAKQYGCSVCCLNLSVLQNQRNQNMNQVQHLSHLIEVKEGSFEQIPFQDKTFNIVWSQDAFIHSGNRRQVLMETKRILKQGGELIFTDTLQNDDCSPKNLQSAFDRLQVHNAGSFGFYRTTLQELGFSEIKVIDLSIHVARHYIRFRDELLKRYDELCQHISPISIENTLKSIEPWIRFYQQGDMQWGLFHYTLS